MNFREAVLLPNVGSMSGVRLPYAKFMLDDRDDVLLAVSSRSSEIKFGELVLCVVDCGCSLGLGLSKSDGDIVLG